MIQLPPAMVRHIDHINAMVAGKRSVFGSSNSFQDHGHFVFGLEAINLLPGKCGLEFNALYPRAPGLGEAARDVAFTPAIDRGIHREAEGIIAGRDRTIRVIINEAVIAAHIKLEDLGARRIGRGFLKPRLGDGRNNQRHAKGRSPLPRCRRTIGAEAFQAANRRQGNRQAELLAEHLRRCVNGRDITQHARAKRERVQRQPIAAHGGFGFRRPGQVIPDIGIEPVFRRLGEFVHRQEFAFSFTQHLMSSSMINRPKTRASSARNHPHAARPSSAPHRQAPAVFRAACHRARP